MPQRKGKIVGVAGGITFLIVAAIGLSENCAGEEVELILQREKLCVEQAEYQRVKQEIVAQYDDKTKEYDFNVNNADIVLSVIYREAAAQNKQKLLLEGDKDALVDLLR